jgi:hypothetical protein
VASAFDTQQFPDSPAKLLLRRFVDLFAFLSFWLQASTAWISPDFPHSASLGWTPLGRGSDGRFGSRRFRAKLTPTPFGTHRAFTHALPPSRPPFCLFHRSALFLPAAAQVKEETSRRRQKGKKMKLVEVNKRTKEAVDFLVAALESGHSEVLTAYLGAMAKFHSYSFGNIMLIARQKPDATNVAGLRTWNSLGRFVKRGEKGIFILAPMIGKKRKEEVATAETDCKSGGDARLYGFRAVYVFDITQTEGKDLPTLTEVNGDVSGYRERLFEFVESQSVELSFSERIAPAKGLSHGGKITLLSGMQPAEEFSTLVHEIAHEMLHRGERRTMTTKQVRETEAEAVAFVVCQSLGLQNGSASQDYIQLWHGDANLLRESLEAVQQAATAILGALSPEDARSKPGTTGASRLLDASVRSTLKMSNRYEAWITDVQQALSSINMSMDDWQSRWPFDFQAEFKAETKADDAAIKANRFWWHEQNKSLKQDCRLTQDCWLPRGHQDPCQPVNSDSRLAPSYQRGDYVKVEFPDETTGVGEWMWVRVTGCDEQKKLVFGVLDNEPLNNYEGKVALGSELAISYSQIREHRKPTEFTRQ